MSRCTAAVCSPPPCGWLIRSASNRYLRAGIRVEEWHVICPPLYSMSRTRILMLECACNGPEGHLFKFQCVLWDLPHAEADAEDGVVVPDTFTCREHCLGTWAGVTTTVNPGIHSRGRFRIPEVQDSNLGPGTGYPFSSFPPDSCRNRNLCHHYRFFHIL